MPSIRQNNALEVETPSDHEVRVIRAFNASMQSVWDAHTRPELVRRWMLGPDGWSMTACDIDLRVGGAFNYRWRNDQTGFEFGIHGEHEEIVPICRIVTVERMDGREGFARNTLVLSQNGDGALLTLTMDFGTKEARDAALATGMTDGMEFSYQRIDAMFV